MLYNTSVQYWIDTFYGGDDEGVAIFNYIDSVRAQEGAVPRSILDRDIKKQAIKMAKEMAVLNTQSAREIAKEIIKEMAKEKAQVNAVTAAATRQEKRWWHYLSFHDSGFFAKYFPW